MSASIALPSWGACPEGFAQSAIEGASICVPPARVVCSDASFQPIGSANCEAVDDGCSGARFREVRATDRAAVFVDATASPGGDGSELAPYASIDDALQAGATGILLAAGDYTLAALLPPDVDLRGVCADRVRIVASAARPVLVVERGRRAALTGITLSGAGLGPVVGGTLRLDGVAILGLGGWGTVIDGGALEARRVVVRAPQPSAEGSGLGMIVTAGGSARLSDVVIEDAHDAGIFIDASASIEGHRVVVQRILPDATGHFGGGISASDDASLVLSESQVTGVHAFGIMVHGADATLDRVVVEQVSAPPSEPVSKGIDLNSATASLTHIVLGNIDGVGLFVAGAAVVSASDLLVRDVRVLADFASGIFLEGELELDRAMLLDTAYVGVYVRAGRLSARDLVVHRVAWAPDAGSALASTLGAVSSVTRFSFTDLSVRGAGAVGEGSQITLESGEIRRVSVGPDGEIGRAVEASEGGQAVLRSVIIDDVVETALMAIGLTEVGTLAFSTRMALNDVRISHIRERPCASTTCATAAGGTGVASLYGATVIAEQLVVNGAPLCGVQVVDRSQLDVQGSTLEGCAIGACVAIEGYELARIVSTTRFVDNERNLETAAVYVPARGPSL
jgi:hypothetical protein